MTEDHDAFIGRLLDVLAGIGFAGVCVGVYILMLYLGW
jgi:hypothetical protein